MVGAWLGMVTGQISIGAALARNTGNATDGGELQEGMIRQQEDAKAEL